MCQGNSLLYEAIYFCSLKFFQPISGLPFPNENDIFELDYESISSVHQTPANFRQLTHNRPFLSFDTVQFGNKGVCDFVKPWFHTALQEPEKLFTKI